MHPTISAQVTGDSSLAAHSISSANLTVPDVGSPGFGSHTIKWCHIQRFNDVALFVARARQRGGYRCNCPAESACNNFLRAARTLGWYNVAYRTHAVHGPSQNSRWIKGVSAN